MYVCVCIGYLYLYNNLKLLFNYSWWLQTMFQHCFTFQVLPLKSYTKLYPTSVWKKQITKIIIHQRSYGKLKEIQKSPNENTHKWQAHWSRIFFCVQTWKITSLQYHFCPLEFLRSSAGFHHPAGLQRPWKKLNHFSDNTHNIENNQVMWHQRLLTSSADL